MKPIKIPRLKKGDKVMFVSPASTPGKDRAMRCKEIIESWGLEVVIGEHAFDKKWYLAGEDSDRLLDINNAIQDKSIRAIFATTGGKGAYRIADKLDFDSLKKDPKFIVGFSEITVLHLIAYSRIGLPGIHGPLVSWPDEYINQDSINHLKKVLMVNEDTILTTDNIESTAVLTTRGTAEGVLIGGNLDMVTTSFGWALPDLSDKLLFIEAGKMGYGQVDRQLTQLLNSGALDGVKGIVVGQFTQFEENHGITIIDILQDRLSRLNVPILGGIRAGHGKYPATIPLGTYAKMDADNATLQIDSPVL